ncbi:hypothetical protein KJ359_007014 [Pestalotiopsis sp. 9143b]|nr:hypothetical protein KJ359_007014 [Pestalotiopsis sp. 9143b]
MTDFKETDLEASKEEISDVSLSPDAANAQVDPALEKALVWKQDLRIIPLSAGIYLLCYLDRSNIGNAKVLNSSTHNDLLTETNMTAFQFTIALMVFLIAYALFEVPSNYFLKKMRPSRWISFLMFSWGAITMGLGGTTSYASVTVVRFLLGVFEAGLFPGLVYYLTFWYRTNERSIRVAAILASATLAGAFGGAIAYGVGHMNQTAGLSGWRWLFILEGIPSILSSVLVYFFLPDYPETARWLSSEEKDLASARLAFEGSHGSGKSLTWSEAKETIFEWRLWVHYMFENLQAQLMTVPPYAVAYVVTLAASWSADHFNA